MRVHLSFWRLTASFALLLPATLYAAGNEDGAKKERAAIDTSRQAELRLKQGEEGSSKPSGKLELKKPDQPQPSPDSIRKDTKESKESEPSDRPRVNEKGEILWDTEFYVLRSFPQGRGGIASFVSFAE